MNSASGSTSKGITLESLKAQVQRQLKEELGDVESVRSHEYEQFRRDNMPRQNSWYEKSAAWAGKVVGISPGKRGPDIQRQIDTAHMSISPSDVLALAIIAPFFTFILSLVFTVFVPFLFTGNLSLWFMAFSVIIAIMLYVPLNNMPHFLARRWRQQASNQMVLCVFYMVTYMRHTPNLELAIEFASAHIGPPLALDLKKILWDVETERYQSVSESFENYLKFWRGDANEFIEAIHLIESSLFENTNERRLASLDKSLEVMLDETYEKMLHYAQDLKSPLTMLHMLGIILPVLGLVILPLAVSFFDMHWTVIFSMYNVLLPLGVFYMGKRILSTRPTGYGEADISQLYHEMGEHSKNPAVEALFIAGVLLLIGLSPLFMHWFGVGEIEFGPFEFLGYTDDGYGPFGLGAGLISICITLAAGLGLWWFYHRRTRSLIEIRRRSRQLEDEFASALFQLGNRIGDGIPAEIAFGKVAATMEGTRGGDFFALVANNITRLGMGVEEAIFNPKHGALVQYPSNLIESSMKVLVESSRKGPVEASKALMSMSTYIKEMHRVDERLKDLLADVLSSMKSQVNFLLPTIAAIVIGITSMITAVLGAIQEQAADLEGGLGGGGLPVDLFGMGIPTYYFQIVVGIYVVQVVWILAFMISGIENGVDTLSEEYVKGKSLFLATIMYSSIAFVVILAFNLLAASVLSAF